VGKLIPPDYSAEENKMVQRITQQTNPRGAAPSTRFANAETFGSGRGLIAAGEFIGNAADTAFRKAEADASVNAARIASDSEIQLDLDQQEFARTAPAGGAGITAAATERFDQYTEKQKESLANGFERERYEKWRIGARAGYIKKARSLEVQEGTRNTVANLEDTAQNYGKMFQNYDLQDVVTRAPAQIAQMRQAIADSPLSPAGKAAADEKLTRTLTDAAMDQQIRLAPEDLGAVVSEQIDGTPDGLAELVLHNEDRSENGTLVENDGGSGSPALFGINRRSFPAEFDEVKALHDAGKFEEARNKAKAFYKTEIIAKNGIDKMDPDVAVVVADGVTNHRFGIQRQLVEAAQAGATADELIDIRQKEYDRLVAMDPEKHGPSYNGWMNRLEHVKGVIAGGGGTVTGNAIFDMGTIDQQKNWLNKIESEKSRKQVKYKAELKNTINDNLSMVQAGVTDAKLSERDFQKAYGDIAPLKWNEYQQNYIFNSTTGTIKGMTPAQINGLITNAKPKAGEGFANRQKNYETMVSSAQNELKTRIDDPMAFAQREGLASGDPVNFSDLDNIGEALTARNVSALSVNEAYGLPYAPLTKGEVKSLTAGLPSMRPEQELSLINSMHSSFGNNSVKVFEQIGEEDAIFAHIGGLTSVGGSSKTALDVLRGRRYVAENPKAVDTKGIDAAFRDKMGNAYQANPEAGESVRKSAAALYYVRAMQKGKSEAFDDRAYNEAVDEVLGNKSDSILEYNDNNIVVPVGVYANEFEDWLDDMDDNALKQYSANGKPPMTASGRAVSAKTIKQAELITVGNGEYLVKFPDGLLKAGDEPYRIKYQ